ncbi:hypothetical protein K0M31_002680 [Melipona bicolor]|uniref:Uncharacterized protein n=1 Tax=Melipona bicolor TaxID=60889 RepID=A0AA40FZZ9_9HYME|nr:hypothetical protein K0M31_002680 [Melipona bicolor]
MCASSKSSSSEESFTVTGHVTHRRLQHGPYHNAGMLSPKTCEIGTDSLTTSESYEAVSTSLQTSVDLRSQDLGLSKTLLGHCGGLRRILPLWTVGECFASPRNRPERYPAVSRYPRIESSNNQAENCQLPPVRHSRMFVQMRGTSRTFKARRNYTEKYSKTA